MSFAALTTTWPEPTVFESDWRNLWLATGTLHTIVLNDTATAAPAATRIAVVARDEIARPPSPNATPSVSPTGSAIGSIIIVVAAA